MLHCDFCADFWSNFSQEIRIFVKFSTISHFFFPIFFDFSLVFCLFERKELKEKQASTLSSVVERPPAERMVRGSIPRAVLLCVFFFFLVLGWLRVERV